jgi:hypothetical protein
LQIGSEVTKLLRTAQTALCGLSIIDDKKEITMKGLIRLISKLWLIMSPFVLLWGVYFVFYDKVTKEVAIFLIAYFIIGGWLFGDKTPYKDTMYDGVSPTLDNLIYPNNILRYDNDNNN